MQKQLLFTIFNILVFSITLSAQTIINVDAIKTVSLFNESGVNSANLESSPVFLGDKVGFVYTESKTKIFDKSIELSFFQLGASDVNIDNSLMSMKPLHKKINSEFHEGPMSYDLERNLLYFTRSHKDKRIRKGVEMDTFYLRIFTADLNLSNPKVQPVNINVENFSVCHPTLSKDGQKMIFSSNQPGGHGKMDLYTAYLDNGHWISIINLGPNINSEYNEVFPNFINDSLLVFASNRPGGMGGLDMYVSKLKNGEWSKPEILPAPFNTSYDDLGLILRDNLKSGYFASNRQGGKGNDDIYRFESQIPIFGEDKSELVTAYIRLMDKLTLEPIPNASVVLTPLHIDINNFSMSSYNIDMLSGKDPGDLILKLSPKKGQSFPELYTKGDGLVTFQIKKTQKFLINFNADEFSPLSFIYDYSTHGKYVNIVMEPADVEVSDDLTNFDETQIDSEILFAQKTIGDVVVLDNIYFEYNSSKLDLTYTPELNALYKSMRVNDKMRILINSHTDSRGTADYNMQLSINRANAVRDYLTENGIDEDRISIKGYGETRLRNHCKDNVPCSEAEHRYNRRTEIVILEN